MSDPKSVNDFEIEQIPDDNPVSAEQKERAMQAKAAAEEALSGMMNDWKGNINARKNAKQEGLKSARDALVKNLKGEIGFKDFVKQTSSALGFFGAIWAKITYKKQESRAINKIEELEQLMEINQRDMADDQERERNLKQEIVEKEAKGPAQEKSVDEKGDLAYHEYTGRGYEFQGARAETLAKTDSEKTLSGFKEEVFHKAHHDLIVRIAELEAVRRRLKDELETYEVADIGLAMDAADAPERLTDSVLPVRERLDSIDIELKNMDTAAKEDKKRLAEINKSKEPVQKNIDKLNSEIESHNADYQEAKRLFNLANTSHDEISEEYNQLINDKVNGKEFSPAELEHFAKVEADYKKIDETLKKITPTFRRLEAQRLNAEKDLAGYESEKAELEQEAAEINKRTSEAPDKRAALLEEQKTLQEKEAYMKDNLSDYDKALGASRKLKYVESQIDAVKLADKNLERDILNTDVTDFLLDNTAHDRVRGISINGKEYLDENQMREMGISGNPPLDAKEAARTREMEKIVRALKSRDIFKHANGLNIGEYATFNEKTGKFELYKGDLGDSAARDKFNMVFQSKYFPDSTALTDHLIKENPSSFRKQMLGGAIVMAAKKIKNDLVTGIKNLPKTIPKKLSEFPLFGKLFESDDPNTYVQVAKDEKRVNESIIGCCNTLDQLSGSNKTVPAFKIAMVAAMSDLATMKVVFHMMAKAKPVDIDMVDIGQYMLTIENYAEELKRSGGAVTEQAKAAKEMMEAGHERFSAMMKSALAQSKIEMVNNIVDLSTDVLKDAFILGTGMSSMIFNMGVGMAGSVAKGIHSAVMNAKSKKEFLESPSVLGGIQYDKKLISDKDFDIILNSVTGIRSKDELANTLHVMDAIDMVKAAKETMGKDAEVTKGMKALGYKNVHNWDKVTVNDILKKTTGKDMDAKKTLRNATEKEGFHFATFFRKIWDSIFHSKAGEATINTSRREFTLKKQNETLRKKNLDESLRRSSGAKKLYDMYRKKIKEAAADPSKDFGNYVREPKTGQKLSVDTQRETLIQLFSMTPEAMAITDRRAGALNAAESDKLLNSAVTGANRKAMEAMGMNPAEIQASLNQMQAAQAPEQIVQNAPQVNAGIGI